MNHRRTLGSLFVDRRISTKVALGFASVLAILAVVSATAWFAFRSSAEGFTAYAQRVSVVGIARDVDRGFLNLRRFAREYAFTSEEADVEAAKHEEATLRTLLRQGLSEIRNPERHRRVEDIATAVDAYVKSFNQVVAQTRVQNKMVQTVLDPLGLAQRQHFEALIAAATKAGDNGVTTLANEGLKHFMLARLEVNKLLGRHEATAAADAEKAFANLNVTLQGIQSATLEAEYRKIREDLQAGVTAYREAFHNANALEGEIIGLINGPMRELAHRVQTDAEAIKASGIAEEKQEEQATLTAMDQTSLLILGLATGGTLLGAALAWLIGRGIAVPVVRMSAAMGSLAAGDKTIEVPGLTRGDEVGAMARTVDVFKRNALEMDRLRAEQETQKREAQAERQAALRQLADGFEGQVGSVIQAVSAATSQLQAASKHMEDNAARTSAEATSVSSASAEAAANAQAVASASEELTASIAEIAKQVESARVIAGRADSESKQTTEQVQKLSQTVTAIGAIVALINNVASQTNLLALNATIEAARAGDAGKGFAVVASEVKNLANQTAKATEEIASKIDAVQSGTEEAAKAIASITRVMSEMSSISATIAAAVEEQSSATAEIARNVEQSASGTQEVSMRIAKVDMAARETGTTAVEINGSAAELSSQALTLRTEVERFLEQVRSDKETLRLLSWDDAWSVNIPSIDRHHREFLDGVNQLFGLLMHGEGRAAVPRMADLIARSIEPHFAEEEELMRRHRYPQLAAHQQAHKTILGRFKDASRALEAGQPVDAAGFFDFVAGWFREHMREYDGPMAKFMHMREAA